MIKITSTNDVIIVEGDELTRHYPNNGTLVIPKNSTLVLLDEKSEMVLFKSASNYDTLFTGILGSISIEDEIVTRENIIEKFNAISNVNVGGNVDLFEVVQSLPTENIKNNKVYLVLDSNGSEGNTYVEYLYVNGQWEELGKFKVNVDLSGYATEQWVNEQGFLKEHQDISNLATKAELATKQDVISDLETIRSGAAKGATALQSVPSTYAKKTDILSAKTDTRYTTFDVQNPVLSGKTILLQNEVTDSRKYHTFGYDKTVSELVKATNHINVTRGYNNVPSMETDIESGISLNTTSNGFHDISGSVTIPLDNYDAVTTILHYEVSNVERDSEGNVTGGSSSTDVVDVTYDPNTKVLSYPDVGFLFAQITRTDTNKELFGGNNDGYAYQENGRQCYNFEQHPLQEGGTLIWNPYYSDQYFWNYSVTIDVNSLKEVQVSTDNKPERLNDYIRYANDVKAYILTDKNTTFKTINGQQITGDGDITIDTNVDLSNYYTKTQTNELVNPKLEQVTLTQAEYDALQTKEENVLYIISDAEDIKFKTINGQQITGNGDITIEGGADLSGYYTKGEIDEMIGGASNTITEINNLVG